MYLFAVFIGVLGVATGAAIGDANNLAERQGVFPLVYACPNPNGLDSGGCKTAQSRGSGCGMFPILLS